MEKAGPIISWGSVKVTCVNSYVVNGLVFLCFFSVGVFHFTCVFFEGHILAPLGQEGLLIEKHVSGKFGGKTDWENQACLYIQKGSGKNREGGTLGTRRLADVKTWVWKNLWENRLEKPGLLIYTKGVLEKTGKGAPLRQEGLLIEKHGSGKIGGQTDWENQACLYIQKGSGKKQERGHPWDKKACL